jgi:hypothetical protein
MVVSRLQKKNMNKLFFTILFILALSFSATAQIIRNSYPDMLAKRCLENKSLFSSFILQDSGDIMLTPCTGNNSIFNGSLLLRKGSQDYYPYSQGLDMLTEYSTSDLFGQNMGVDFYINTTPFSSGSVYSNARFTTTYKSPNRAGALLGLFSSATLDSEAPVHDIQGIHGEALASSGQAASGLYGGVFNVRMLGGQGHGNIADLAIGTSVISNTDVRNYFRLWIKKPTLTNATVRDGRNLSIYQEGPYGSEFQGYMFFNNANTNSSGAAVTPVQVKLANAQTADALTVNDYNNVPLFSVSSTGQLRVVNPTTPASSSDACSVGTITWDANNIYVCVAQNTWRRSQLASF